MVAARLATRARDESGAVIVLVALGMVAFLGLAALVIDMGGLYERDRELQTAADAGALAGVQELVYTEGSHPAAESLAQQYVDSNAAVSGVVPANLTQRDVAVDDTSVTVDLREDGVPFFFAKALGFDTGSVRAHARAEIKYATGVENAFPVAMMYANPHHWRFTFKQGTTEVARFDLYDGDGDGLFTEVQDRVPGAWTPGPGDYSVYMAAMDSKNRDALELAGPVGLFYVPAAESKLKRIGLERVGGSSVRVYAQVDPSIADATIPASFGKGQGKFDLVRQGDGTYQATVTPAVSTGNDGWDTTDLYIDHKDFEKNRAVARYVGFHPDVPILDVMMSPTYDGYSAATGSVARPGAYVRVLILEMGVEYEMKLSTKEGSNYLSGNWRWADIFGSSGSPSANLKEELARIDTPPNWYLNTPLFIGGPLWPETGAAVGHMSGLDIRIPPGTPLDDPRRVVTIPIVDFASDLHGTSEKYTISAFAAFRITSWVRKGEDKGEIRGQFERWVAPGPWQNTPPGPLYIETAVLTE